MDMVTYMTMLFVAAMAIWQAVALAAWIWGKVRRPEPEKMPPPNAIQRSLDCIARDMESREENGKSA